MADGIRRRHGSTKAQCDSPLHSTYERPSIAHVKLFSNGWPPPEPPVGLTKEPNSIHRSGSQACREGAKEGTHNRRRVSERCRRLPFVPRIFLFSINLRPSVRPSVRHAVQ